MRRVRFSIAGLMAVVFIASLALAALRSGSEVWAGAMFLATCAVMALAVVGAACDEGAGRVWWLGFALCGWGYLFLVFHDPYARAWPELPTIALTEALRTR